MGISLILTRSFDKSFQETGLRLNREDWESFIESDPDVRLRTKPHIAVNPRTGESISIGPGELETELHLDGIEIPFLTYANGDLRMGFSRDLDDPSNPVRLKIADIAESLDMLITHDAGDEVLNWSASST